jgi:hypothetical protein
MRADAAMRSSMDRAVVCIVECVYHKYVYSTVYMLSKSQKRQKTIRELSHLNVSQLRPSGSRIGYERIHNPQQRLAGHKSVTGSTQQCLSSA